MKFFFPFILFTILISSCSTISHVNNHGKIQKRKHTSGWFIGNGKTNKNLGKSFLSTQKKNIPSLRYNKSCSDTLYFKDGTTQVLSEINMGVKFIDVYNCKESRIQHLTKKKLDSILYATGKIWRNGKREVIIKPEGHKTIYMRDSTVHHGELEKNSGKIVVLSPPSSNDPILLLKEDIVKIEHANGFTEDLTIESNKLKIQRLKNRVIKRQVVMFFIGMLFSIAIVYALLSAFNIFILIALILILAFFVFFLFWTIQSQKELSQFKRSNPIDYK